MMAETLTPGVPAHIADLFETDEIHWVTGWGNYKTETCLHGALLRPCATPGDEIMWAALLAHRGLTIEWNDCQPSVVPVVAKLRQQADPDEAEMVKVFGPNWIKARTICRTFAAATDEQREALRDARAARAARAARDARDARAARAARAARDARAARAAWAARDARDARAAWAARDARDARDAWAARDAFCATVALPWIKEGTYWDQAAHDRLMEPWVSVFGEASATENTA